MRVEFKGFLTDEEGRDLLRQGSVIDMAIGAESASDHWGSDQWGADSSSVIYGYRVD